MKGVLTARLGSGYDDIPEKQYHFPRTYLRLIERLVGEQVVYYEPRRGGGQQCYFAAARITNVSEDPRVRDHFYAEISDYLDFDEPVRFHQSGFFFETALQKADGSTNKGAFGRAVRELPDAEFEAILALGFAKKPDWAVEEAREAPDLHGFAEEQLEFERAPRTLLTNRTFRDQRFRINVQRAYEQTCAVTGLKILNGGGRPEVQAAHIMPVSAQGPDAVRNGVALSGTVHWLFDRGLISFEDDFRIIAAKSKIPEPILSLFNPSGYAHVPRQQSVKPHPHFLRYHREVIFKG